MRKTRSLEQWRSIIEEQQASDLTITDYCHQKQLFMPHEVSLMPHQAALFEQKSRSTSMLSSRNSQSSLRLAKQKSAYHPQRLHRIWANYYASLPDGNVC